MSRFMRLARHGRALPLLLGLVLFLTFAELRRRYSPPLGDGVDGAYYFQMARQVALGAGLRTSYSVFHMGLSPLPQRATSYPLLPLGIGYLARLMPLERAAVWLPGAAYVLSVVLCFAFLSWVSERSLPGYTHVARLLFSAALATWFGLIPVYVWTSARPYTETVANLILLSNLWSFGWCSTARFPNQACRRSAFFGVGLLSGLCYLARFQLIVVPVALLLARGFVRDRRRFADIAWLILGVLPCLAFQALRLFSMPNAKPYALLDFAMYRQLPDLPPFVYDLQFDHRLDWWLDKLSGVWVSFDPSSEDSYFVQLSYLIWLVPVGLAWLVIRHSLRVFCTKAARSCALRRHGMRRPRHAALLASAWVGLLAVAPLHTVHSVHWRNWSFAWRHGMPLLYLILPIAFWLWAQRTWLWNGLVALLIALSLVMCGIKSAQVVERRVPTQTLKGYADVARYLDSVGPTRGTLGMEHQALAVFTAQPLYWLACWSPPSLARTLVQRLPIERILLRRGELRCRSLDQIRPLLRVEKPFAAHDPMALYRIVRN